MVLRASAESAKLEANLKALIDPSVPSGIPEGQVLLAFCDALLEAEVDELDASREALLEALGAAGLLGAVAIASNFSRNDRIANATGIPLEADFVKQSEDFRQALGINDFKSARNTLG